MKKVSILVMFMVVCFYMVISNIPSVNAGAKCEVKFMFDGLQAIAFGDSNKVTDGILDVHHHTPKLQIKQVEKGKEKIIFNIEGKDLYKKVLNVTVPNNGHKPTRYYSTNMSKDRTDFRWCLDIENDLFQKQLYLKEDKFYTKIHFQVGEFVTENIADGQYQFTSGSKIHSFNREIGAPGAHMELQPSDNLIITGLDKKISLPYQVGVSYKVEVTNLPPKEMANIDHFGFYYEYFEESVTRYMPIMVQKSAFVPRPLLCEAIVLGKSSIN